MDCGHKQAKQITSEFLLYERYLYLAIYHICIYKRKERHERRKKETDRRIYCNEICARLFHNHTNFCTTIIYKNINFT